MIAIVRVLVADEGTTIEEIHEELERRGEEKAETIHGSRIRLDSI